MTNQYNSSETEQDKNFARHAANDSGTPDKPDREPLPVEKNPTQSNQKSTGDHGRYEKNQDS